MKPSVTLVRYLAVLVPLTLGVVLSGCGGLLGPVNGELPPFQVIGPSGEPVSQLTLQSTSGTRTVVRVQLPAGATTFTVVENDPQDVIAIIVRALSARQHGTNEIEIETLGRAGTATLTIQARNAAGGIVASTTLTIIVQHPQGEGTGG